MSLLVSYLELQLKEALTAASMCGTTPPCEMTTSPRSLFNLRGYEQKVKNLNKCYSLLIVSDGELQVTRDDTLFLVVTSCVASKLEDLSSQVLEDGCEVD